jgi:pentatricopeptide repeat protein
MMGGYASSGDGDGALELFEKVLGEAEGAEASRGMLLGAVRACCCGASHASIRTCLWVHDRIVRARLEAETDIASTLIGMYAGRLGRIEEARKVFDAMPRHDAVSLGAMIGGYADCELGLSGLALFRRMVQADERIEPDRLVHVSAVRAFSSSASQRGLPLKEARWIHHSIVECGHDDNDNDDDDAVIGSALVDMYAMGGSPEEAEAVFGRLRRRDAAAWGALIGGYVRNGLADAAFRLFGRMHHRQGLSPSQSIVSSLLKACEMLGSADRGMVLHAQAVESGHSSDAATASSLIAFYCAVGSLDDAASVFDRLPKDRDVVTWGAMIAGHVARGNGAEAMALFEAMARQGREPDSVACVLLLQACAELGAAAHGRLLHGRMVARGLESGAECEHALVAMYAGCGRLEDARRMLARSQAPGVASWGAILAAHAHLGDTASLPRLLQGTMTERCDITTKPDDVIFLSALAACARSGALQEGMSYFGSMIEAHPMTTTTMMMPRPKHYNCLVDLLGRSGSLSDAHDLLRCVPWAPDVVAWLALLSACSVHYNTGLGARCYDAVVSCNGRHDASGSALMSSLRSSLEPSRLLH